MDRKYEELARDLVKAGNILYEQGLVPATSGNFSARIAPDRFAITVSGKHKGHMTIADIMQVDARGFSLDGKRPSAETALHIQIYRRFPDASAILHHHSPYATLLSQFESDEVVLANYELLKAFPGFDTHQTRLRVPVFENSQNIPELAEAVDAYMEVNSPVHGYLIKGHGLYTWGESIEAAMKHVEAFEFLFKCELMKRGARLLMTTLKIFSDDGKETGEALTDFPGIARALNEIGVEFERWEASQPLSKDATQGEVLTAYKSSIDKLNEKYGFKSVDVVALNPDHPDKAAMRQKFLAEHTHADFEVRFFVEGSGLFYLHAGDKVYTILCGKGDLISIPANTTHWFDMGTNPYFKAIRFFTTPDGWVGNFTGSEIAKQFPDFDKYVASLS
jgi:1,2-dihydroxy-3-keto-5-methylthiopentene dioxygenase